MNRFQLAQFILIVSQIVIIGNPKRILLCKKRTLVEERYMVPTKKNFEQNFIKKSKVSSKFL